jgi:hypothetical protein
MADRITRLRRRLLIGLVVAAVLAAMLWVVLFPVWRLLYGHPIGLSEISQETGLIFPHGARLTRSWMQGGFLGGALWARVEMNRSDARRIISTAAPNEKITWVKVSETKDRFDEFMDLKPPDWQAWMWWKPDSVRHGVGAHVDIPWEGGGWADLLIDESGSARVTVYVFCWLS